MTASPEFHVQISIYAAKVRLSRDFRGGGSLAKNFGG